MHMEKERASCGGRAQVVVGLGNPDRSDDGVGPAVVQALGSVEAEVWESLRTGLPLAQALVGFRRALVVDGAPFLPAGEFALFPLGPEQGSSYPHGLGLAQALELLAWAGQEVPEVWALAIGIPADPPFGRGLSPEVARAVSAAVAEVKKWLEN